jgi:uncharacterized protein with PQ loop repeat
MTPESTVPMVLTIIGTVAAILMGLAPVTVMRQIRKHNNVGHYLLAPFVIGLCSSLLSGVYSVINGYVVPVICGAVCLVLYIIYCGIYIHYSDRRVVAAIITIIASVLALGVSVSAPIAFYYLSRQSLETTAWFDARGGLRKWILMWTGIVSCLMIIVNYASQLTNIRYIVRQKDARSISFTMCLGGLLSSAIWAAYGFLVMDPIIIVPNSLGVAASILSLGLKVRFNADRPVFSEDDIIKARRKAAYNSNREETASVDSTAPSTAFIPV